MIGFLLARQRSGTGALGSILSRHPELCYVGEVLHPNPERYPVGQVLEPDIRAQDVNFFVYLRADVDRMHGYCDPNRRADEVERYFDWLKKRFHPRIPIVDVKYRSLHHWNGAWQGMFDPPWLIDYVRERKLPLIHLKRENFLETYVSGQLADQNQVWHSKTPGKSQVVDIEVDTRTLLSLLTETTDEVWLTSSWLTGLDTVLDVEYAELFDASGAADQAIVGDIHRLFDLKRDFPDLTPEFVKQASGSVAASIRNLQAVERTLRGSEFAWMLDFDQEVRRISGMTRGR